MAAKKKKSARQVAFARKKAKLKKAADYRPTFEELQSRFWAGFGAGCSLPIEFPAVFDEGNDHFRKILRKKIKDEVFDDPEMVKKTAKCCTECGELATAYAKIRDNTEIDCDDFKDAVAFLEGHPPFLGGLC